jgi:carbon-monoxide dehydrogenase large subunit
VLTGNDAADDNLGGLICGWMIHSKDGSPMKAGPHPVLAQGKARHVGDPVAVVIAETRTGAAPRQKASRSTTRCCRCRGDRARPRSGVRRRCMMWRPSNTVFEWEIGDKGATDAAFDKAAHVTKHGPGQQPPGAQRHGAARGHRQLRRR